VSILSSAASILLLSLTSQFASAGDRVTMSFDGVPLSKATSQLIDQAGLTFGIPPDPDIYDRPGLGINVRDVPVEIALKAFALAYQVCLGGSAPFVHIRKCRQDSIVYH
jgi:hypothetical protein